MIIGILDKYKQDSELNQELLRVAEAPKGKSIDKAAFWSDQHLAFSFIPVQIDTLDEAPQPFINDNQTIVLVFEGKIYNMAEIKKMFGTDHRFRTGCSGEILIHLYEKYQENFLNQVNGKFCFALWDKLNQKLILGRDRLGIEPLFYSYDGKRLFFSSSLRALLETGWINKQINHQSVLQYLLFCYNPGDETFIRNIYKLPPGHLLILNGSSATIKKYWHLTFTEVQVKSEKQYREEVVDLIKDAIRIRLEPHYPLGVFLSGGIDSSAIVSLTSNMLDEPLHTFSYRCEGKSFDESYYARFVSERYQTKHNEIPYNFDNLSTIFKAVESMDEPFCDAGNEIGTYILGQAASGKASYVFSGEGGDELFGGHPVYTADKVAAVIDIIPTIIIKPLALALQRIPDSDEKKNLQVKLKRFAYSLSFPSELLSHRWRTYYTPRELQQLCTVDFIHHCDMHKMFEGILKYNQAASGKDLLSRSIYSDLMTIVGTYFRRLGMLRTFLIESRVPLLDYRLVEYSAKIPARLKIRRLSNTKYIYKKVLKEVLPRKILYDRPKIGHSIPMKNWLRENAEKIEFIMDVLSSGSFEKRGLFQRDFIHKMVDEHVRKLKDNSHRIWSLVVLELWLKTYLE
jgi:asparagine synthase (glutamine-hydrolysing)